MNQFVSRLLPCLLALLVCLASGGCGKKNKNITKANLEKIKVGMDKADVEAILGRGEDEGDLDLSEGSSVAGAAGITTGDIGSMSKRRTTRWVKWGTDKKFIRMGFENGKVANNSIQSGGL
jgi:hypothetical protein